MLFKRVLIFLAGDKFKKQHNIEFIKCKLLYAIQTRLKDESSFNSQFLGRVKFVLEVDYFSFFSAALECRHMRVQLSVPHHAASGNACHLHSRSISVQTGL